MRRGFILEDVPESQDWLRQALLESFPGIAVDVAETLQEARRQLRDGSATDIALIDLGLPDGSGIEIIDLIQQISPATLCVVASIYDDDGHVFPALRAGARGYLLKDQKISTIIVALRGIAAGEPPLSPAIARRMLAFFNRPLMPSLSLTTRETEVLRLIAKGITQVETARLLV